jgi:hypothetical protein
MIINNLVKKSSIFIVLMVLNFTLLNAESTLLTTEVAAPSDLKGSIFFPLFTGAKWTWSVKGIEGVDTVTWTIDKAYILSDKTNNLTNILGFKVVCKELSEEWYAFEYDGYICFIKNEDNPAVERILPLNPKLEDQWTNADFSFNIAAVEDNMVKVEFINDDASKYGYYMFVKDIGPYEKFDYEISADVNKDIKMTVTDNVDYKTLKYENLASNTTNKEESVNTQNNKNTQPDDANKNQTIDNTDKSSSSSSSSSENTNKKTEKDNTNKTISETKPQITEIPDADYIKKLDPSKIYIQIGAFNMLFNAKDLLNTAKSKGYSAKAFKDTDGYYKILIIVDKGKEKDLLKKVKDSFVKDAYIKPVKSEK